MKGKIFIFLFSILGFWASSQTINGRKFTAFNNYYNWRGGAFDSVLNLPVITPVAGFRAGAVRYNAADSSVYVWTGFQWRVVAGGGGSTDTTSLSNRINLKLNIPDTSSMLTPYAQTSEVPAQFNPIAGTNVTLSGSYPNITFNSSGGGGLQNLQQVTDQGDTTDNVIRFKKDRVITGTILTDNFTGGGFGSANYDSSFSTVTRTFTGSFLQVSGGNATFTNYINYSKYTGRNRYSMSVKLSPTNTGATNYGVAIGTESYNSFYAAGIRAQFSLDNGAFSGKILFWNDAGTLLQTSATGITFSTNDTLIATLTRVDNVYTANFYNKSSNTSLTSTYTISTATVGAAPIPGTGKFAIYFMGGNQNIYNFNISSDETKNNVLVLGNSITVGYTASTLLKRYVSMLFPGRYSYEISGGSGDRSNEGVLKLDEIKSLQPQYVLYSLGVNDAQDGVSAATYSVNTTRIFDTLIANNIIPIAVSSSPNNSVSLTVYNDTLSAIATRYGLKYINTYDTLRNGTAWKTNYTTDNVHPNDSGHLVIARIITREVPYILGDTTIRVNRLIYNADLRYFVGINEKSGSLELGEIDPSGFVELNPISTQTGSIDISGSATSGRVITGTDIGSGFPASIGGSITDAATIVTKNSSASGYSGVTMYDNSGSVQGNISWGNPSTNSVANRNNLNIISYSTTGKIRFVPNGTLSDSSVLTITKDSVIVYKPLTVTSFATGFTSTATGITLGISHHTVNVTATGQTITLPTSVGITGRIYTIKLTASGSGTVATTSSQTIDGSTTYSLASQYKYVTVQSDGANWIIIGNN